MSAPFNPMLQAIFKLHLSSIYGSSQGIRCSMFFTKSLVTSSTKWIRSTPRHTMPRHATPRHVTPRHATPRMHQEFLAASSTERNQVINSQLYISYVFKLYLSCIEGMPKLCVKRSHSIGRRYGSYLLSYI